LSNTYLVATIARVAATDPRNDPRECSFPLSGMLLVKLGYAMQRRFSSALKPSELAPRHLQVLDELRPGPVNQQALADRVGIDPTKLVGVLNDLECLNLVLRRRDPADRRRHIVENSLEGEAQIDAAVSAAAAVEDEFLAALDTEQRAQLQSLLLLVAASGGLSEYCIDPAADAVAQADGGSEAA
jgi:MarR family transcriptional regulator, lower aerobic nicotinate degradation pathway regulator